MLATSQFSKITARPQRRAVQNSSCALSCILHHWWSQSGSNRRPPACKAGALPAELWPHAVKPAGIGSSAARPRPFGRSTLAKHALHRAARDQASPQLSYGPRYVWPQDLLPRRGLMPGRAETCVAGKKRGRVAGLKPVSVPATPPDAQVVGLGGLEPPTSPLSGVRSNHLSYRPRPELKDTSR